MYIEYEHKYFACPWPTAIMFKDGDGQRIPTNPRATNPTGTNTSVNTVPTGMGASTVVNRWIFDDGQKKKTYPHP
jgi:hypothetical protein